MDTRSVDCSSHEGLDLLGVCWFGVVGWQSMQPLYSSHEVRG